MVSLFSENQFAQVILLNWDSIRVRLSNCRVIGTPGRNNVGEHKGAMCSAPRAIDVTPGRSRGGPYEMAMSSYCMRVRTEERRVGKEGVTTGRSWRCAMNKKKKMNKIEKTK